MRYAGVGWRDGGFTTAVVDGGGVPVAGPRAFPADRLSHLVDLLVRLHRDQGLACVLDTSSGALERHLIEAGIPLYRADPGTFTARDAGGSVAPATLAELGRRRLPALHRLTLDGGGLAGRDDEVDRAVTAAARVEAGLAGRGRFVTRGDPARPAVALTFDDGPNPPYTLQVLDALRRHGARATFFCVGLAGLAHPEVLRRIAGAGHEVANHTWSHPYLPDLTAVELRAQVERTTEVLAAAVGRAPTLFRPPYGGRDTAVLEWLGASGLTTVLWDVEVPDWTLPGAAVIEDGVVDATRPGSIVLLHDGGGDRSQGVRALPAILCRLAERGLRFVTVGELMAPAGASGSRA